MTTRRAGTQVVGTRAGLRFYNHHLVVLHSGLLIATQSNIPCTGSVVQVHITVSLHMPFLYKYVSF